MTSNTTYYHIPGGTLPGHVTEVSGNVVASASRIEFALQLCNNVGVPIGEAILCSFRFPEKEVVMNSKLDGVYGLEEREPNPMSPQESVVFQLACTQDGFNVICNKKLVHQYSHRIKDFASISQLSVSGDLIVTDVKP